jgi:hypothetical protein
MANFGEVNAQNRDQQGAWTTSDNDTTIRCCEASNDVDLRSVRATMVRLCSTAATKRRNGSRGRGRGSAVLYSHGLADERPLEGETALHKCSASIDGSWRVDKKLTWLMERN